PSIAAGASSEEQQAWRETVSGRIDALAIDFATVIALQKQNAETVASALEKLAAMQNIGEQVSALAQRLDGMEAGIAEMQPVLASLQEAPGEMRAVASNVGTLSERVSSLEGQAGAADEAVSAASAKVASLEQVMGGWKSAIDNVRLSQSMFRLANV